MFFREAMASAVRYLVLASSALLITINQASATDWMVRVQTMSRVCHVQLKTAAPLGEDFRGPFSSRREACREAAVHYDEMLSDPSKCWTYGGGTVTGCKRDGVTLPPKKPRSAK